MSKYEIENEEMLLPKIQTTPLTNVNDTQGLSINDIDEFRKLIAKFSKDKEFSNVILPDFIMKEYPDNFDKLHQKVLDESKYTNEIINCNTEEERKAKILERLRKRKTKPTK